ncbi:MAG: hypothetical protein KF901_10585 [Myxococcales bacterium]|nr:hypothetical protein [Myxococcales bacterium]
MKSELPRLSTTGDKPVFVVGRKPDAKAKGGLVALMSEPSARDLEELAAFLREHGPRTIVRVGAKVPLVVLDHVTGAPVVMLEGGRKTFDGLGALPESVRRLSVGKQPKPFSLADLPPDHLEELELDVASVTEFGPLPKLRTLGWTRMADAGAAFVTRQPTLHELGLRASAITRLPASAVLQRLILLQPTELTSLFGIDALPALTFLRVDAPKGMERLGSLSAASALETLLLVSAHRIADLSDIGSAPKLEMLGVLGTKLDETPFLNLEGKLSGGSFQLQTHAASKRLFAHLGIPYRKAELIENRFFDEP